jgi:hypothetical protein
MERRLFLVLAILSLVLMGGECEFGARVGTRPPEEEDGTGSTGGLAIGIQTGTAIETTNAAAAASRRQVVAVAVGVSAWTPSIPAFEPMDRVAAASSSRPDLFDEPIRLASSSEVGRVAPVSSGGGAASPVPEPGGVHLFLVGLGIVQASLRRPRSEMGPTR